MKSTVDSTIRVYTLSVRQASQTQSINWDQYIEQFTMLNIYRKQHSIHIFSFIYYEHNRLIKL